MQYNFERFDAYFRAYLRRGICGGAPHKNWNYKDDLTILGAYDLYRATGDVFFRDRILDLTGELLPPDDQPLGHNLDTISFGKTDLVLLTLTGNERWRRRLAAKQAALAEHPRTESGNFWHKDIYPWQVWLDGLYMALPVYLQDPANAEDALHQIEEVRRRLYLPEKGLYRHAWDERRAQEWADPETGLSPCVWLRAEGWFLMMLADIRELMPRQQEKERLDALLLEAVNGLLPYRDRESGMFLQLVDLAGEPGNYPETSGSAMAAYAMMKGARLGMLPAGYFQRGAGVLAGIQDTGLKGTGDTLVLDGICGSAGLGPGPDHRTDRDGSVAYYLSEAIRPDNQHGAAACMMAYSEYLRGNR
nr:glycoside hydrolase family 88 protein [uncultured Gemmiger sp.]